jgi:glycosyltransferase involved in cell wall biosynthesis
MTRVLIVQPVIPHYTVRLFDALATLQDLDVHVVASPRVPGAPVTVDNLPSWADAGHRCREALAGRVFWQTGLKIPDAWKFGDVVCVDGAPRFLSNIPILWDAWRRGLGIIWWGHGWSATSVAWRARVRCQMMRISDVILLYTEREAKELTARLGAHIPIIGLNNTIDSRPIRDAVAEWPTERLSAFRRAHGFSEDGLLLFCGRLRSSPSTELDVALHGLARLAQRHKALRLAIIGAGEEKVSLANLAQHLGISDRIIWVGPLFDERQLAPWFLSATAFVYPGTVGLSLLHALSYGLPVITHDETRKQGPEIAALEDGVNGYTFRRGDAEHLATLIDRLVTNPELRESMSRRALRTTQEDYSFTNMIARFSRAISDASRISLAKSKVS